MMAFIKRKPFDGTARASHDLICFLRSQTHTHCDATHSIVVGSHVFSSRLVVGQWICAVSSVLYIFVPHPKTMDHNVTSKLLAAAGVCHSWARLRIAIDDRRATRCIFYFSRSIEQRLLRITRFISGVVEVLVGWFFFIVLRVWLLFLHPFYFVGFIGLWMLNFHWRLSRSHCCGSERCSISHTADRLMISLTSL